MLQFNKKSAFYVNKFKVLFIVLWMLVILISLIIFNLKIERNVYVFKLNFKDSNIKIDAKIKRALVNKDLKNHTNANVHFLNVYYEAFSLDNSEVVWVTFLSKKGENYDEFICEASGFSSCDFRRCTEKKMIEKVSRAELCRFYEY